MIPAMDDGQVIGRTQRQPLEVVRGEGPFVFDAEGSKYLDAYASRGEAVLGHGHPAVASALRHQAGTLVSANALSEKRRKAAALLCDLAPGNLERVLFTNSADEANEAALMIARRFRDRRKVIAFRGGYHGRTYGANSVTALPPYDRQHVDRVPGTILCRWGDLEHVRRVLGGDVAGIIVEPVQVLGGARTADAEFLRELESLCRARAGALILDETRAGPARCGAGLAAVLQGVTPHLITLGPSIANGVPCGAVLIDRGMSETISGPELDVASAGGPLVAAAAEATLRALREGAYAAKAAALGVVLAERLAAVPGVREVRGLGLLRGIIVDADAAAVAERMRTEGQVLVGTCADAKVLLVAPPLVVEDAHVDLLVDALSKALA
jgi:acetylornithine/succinyldiaminopimelate/putrescine aminotransferase